jgi:peptidoglycan/xylan/chitin deacetylase (PgdA/CDA1 family)
MYSLELKQSGSIDVLLGFDDGIIREDSVDIKTGNNQRDFNIDTFVPRIMMRHLNREIPDSEMFSPVPIQVYYRGNAAFKRVAITLDDGFSRDDTLLDLLEQYGVRCTVFIIGGRGIGTKRGDWIERMDGMGFEVCNHTFNHTPITSLSDTALEKELRDTQKVITGITKKMYPYFRPPSGIYDKRTLGIVARNGFLLINWSNSIGDSVKGNTVPRQVQYVFDHLKAGDIILAHFGAYNTYEVMKQIIPGIRKRGFELVTISEILEGM